MGKEGGTIHFDIVLNVELYPLSFVTATYELHSIYISDHVLSLEKGFQVADSLAELNSGVCCFITELLCHMIRILQFVCSRYIWCV